MYTHLSKCKNDLKFFKSNKINKQKSFYYKNKKKNQTLHRNTFEMLTTVMGFVDHEEQAPVYQPQKQYLT
jgi:hypothetical protein